jgi:outer membrane protein TolC
MKRYLYRWFVGLQIGCLALTGCHPTQPFFLRERGDLAHYIDRSQRIEYADLQLEPTPEASQSLEPLSLQNQHFEYLDLTLEECIVYALNNTQIVRALPGSQRQNAEMAATVLSSPAQQLSTIHDPAITANTTSSQPAVVDQNGNRVLPRGSARATQTGGVEDALSEFDAQYSSFMSFNTTDRARNVGAGNVFNPQQFLGRDTTAQMAISKRIATGGVVTARSQSIYSFNNIPTQASGLGNFGRAVPSDYTQIFEFQVQHPLMRGRGTLVNRIPVVLARINEDISIGQYEERVRNLVRDVELAYWDLYAAYFNVENARAARDSAAFAYRQISIRGTTAGESKISETQARANVYDFQAQLDAALAGGGPGNDPGLFGRDTRLRFLMGWAASDGKLIRPTDKPALSKAEFDWDSVKAETLTRNIDIRQQKWLVKQRELELISSKNQILPDLNLSLGYRFLGVGSSLIDRHGGNAPFPAGRSSAFEELLGGDYQEGTIRMDFTPNPFGSRRALADIQRSQLDLARSHRVLEAKEEAAISTLTNLWQQLDSLHEQMMQQIQSYNANHEFVELQTIKLNKSASAAQDIDLLIRAQQAKARAGQFYIRVLAEYNKTLAEFHALKGSLLEYNNISLEEGLWPEKAYWDAHERARERDAARFMDYGASRPRVISRGEFEQNTGTANSQARPASPDPGGPSSANPDSKSNGKESVPALPDRANEELPEKRAGYQSKPKFQWDK